MAVQEGMPVARIHALQIEEVKAGEGSSGAIDCMVIFDPVEDFYENLVTLFTNLKPGLRTRNSGYFT